jgi:tryptophanyl-tRNA synthetase
MEKDELLKYLDRLEAECGALDESVTYHQRHIAQLRALIAAPKVSVTLGELKTALTLEKGEELSVLNYPMLRLARLLRSAGIEVRG